MPNESTTENLNEIEKGEELDHILDASLGIITKEVINNVETEMVEANANMFLEHNDNRTSAEEFAKIIICDDIFESKPISSRLITSPKIQKPFDFVNVDYLADEDIFNLDMGLTMSRSESLESLPVNDLGLFFSEFDTAKEFPRISSPSVSSPNLLIESEKEEIRADEQNEQTVEEKEEIKKEALIEIRIDRAELIEKICADLDLKERLQSKNSLLQNKLAEYFKKKRVKFN